MTANRVTGSSSSGSPGCGSPGCGSPGFGSPGSGSPGSGAPEGVSLGHLVTEAVRPELATLDLLGAFQLVSLMASDSRRATDAVAAAAPAIAAAVELVCDHLAAGGRLIYVGAGTAGRLAVLDAAELGPPSACPRGGLKR